MRANEGGALRVTSLVMNSESPCGCADRALAGSVPNLRIGCAGLCGDLDLAWDAHGVAEKSEQLTRGVIARLL